MDLGVLAFVGGAAIGFIGALLIFVFASMSKGGTRHNRP